jgi:hypothetical protein
VFKILTFLSLLLPSIAFAQGQPTIYYSHANSSALENSHVIKATSGILGNFYCTAITGGAAGYCIVYNGTSVPATGALTATNVLDSCYIPATATGCAFQHMPFPVYYSSGIVILISSAATPFTYTTGTDTGFISADYN